MSAQPSNEECADMFRVMMFEMMEMHPAWQQLKYRLESFENVAKAKKYRMTKADLEYHFNRLKEIFEERK